MIHAIGYREKTSPGNHTFVIDSHISQKDYNNHTMNLNEVKKLKTMTAVYELLLKNKEEYSSFSVKLKKELETKKTIQELEALHLEINRLLINYLSSLQMFVDYGEKHNKEHFGKDKMKEFQQNTHYFYDNHVSYRFMVLMRNYAVHYGFPLHKIIQSEKKNGVFSLKDTLLNFKGWKHVKGDLNRMPELIDLDPHVNISMLFIKNLYENYIYDMAPTIIKSVEYMSDMLKRFSGRLPIFVKFETYDDFKRGNFKVELIELNTYIKAIEILKSHPNITITKKQ
ncbi:hypothetical protein AB0857_06005 [Bacillus velezensis]|uniref:hypothetical protein n=1 Tax=Bacillus velezensis TaxID=492670 RepID=UPI000C226EB1|nr:hypothetical protein [Bacillus velezensis]ATY29078.1 hypothetical protein CVD07_12525 [Bacillus velezensis]